MDPASFLLIVGAGLLAGVVSGLFGVGGGVLMVPAALYLIPGTPFHAAKAASLVVITVSAGVGIWTHARRRSVDFDAGAFLALGGLLGTVVTVLLVERVADDTLRAGFGILLALTGLRLAMGREPKPHDLLRGRRRVASLGLGFVGGVLAGAFGVGGGIVMVPGLIFLGTGMHLAVGTSLVAVLSNAAAGTVTHVALQYGPELATLGVPLAIGAVPGTRIGSVLAHKLHAERLRRLFGAFLILVGLGMSVQQAVASLA